MTCRGKNIYKRKDGRYKGRYIKYHALRHTFSTRALDVGMNYKTLFEILGHSSVGITLDLYAHSLKEHKQKQINKLDEIFNE